MISLIFIMFIKSCRKEKNIDFRFNGSIESFSEKIFMNEYQVTYFVLYPDISK